MVLNTLNKLSELEAILYEIQLPPNDPSSFAMLASGQGIEAIIVAGKRLPAKFDSSACTMPVEMFDASILEELQVLLSEGYYISLEIRLISGKIFRVNVPAFS